MQKILVAGCKKNTFGKRRYFGLFLLLICSMHTSAQNADVNILNDINPGNPGSGYFKTMSSSAYFVSAAAPLYFLTTGILKNDITLKQKSRNIFCAIGIELIVSESMKSTFNRNRPAQTYPGIIFPYKDVKGRSFPSGHTSLVFATAASLSMQCKKWYVTVPAYAYAASVGYSRMYLGVHYPSDVIAGAAVGIGSAYLSEWLNKKLFKK